MLPCVAPPAGTSRCSGGTQGKEPCRGPAASVPEPGALSSGAGGRRCAGRVIPGSPTRGCPCPTAGGCGADQDKPPPCPAAPKHCWDAARLGEQAWLQAVNPLRRGNDLWRSGMGPAQPLLTPPRQAGVRSTCPDMPLPAAGQGSGSTASPSKLHSGFLPSCLPLTPAPWAWQRGSNGPRRHMLPLAFRFLGDTCPREGAHGKVPRPCLQVLGEW